MSAVAAGHAEPWWGECTPAEMHYRSLEASSVGHVRHDAQMPSDRYCGRACGAYKETLQPLGNAFRATPSLPRYQAVRLFARVAIFDSVWVADVRQSFAGGVRALCWCQRFGSSGPSCHAAFII